MHRLWIIVLAFLLVSASTASAQTFLEHYTTFGKDGTVTPTMTGQIEIPTKSGVNAYAYFLVNDGWAEGVYGISKLVRPWLSLSGGAGVETDENPWRVLGSVWAGQGKYSVFYVGEQGGSGYWYKAIGLVVVTPRLELGILSQQYFGHGPLVQINLPGRFAIWNGWQFKGGASSILGFNKKF